MRQNYYKNESWLPEVVVKEQVKEILRQAKHNLNKPLKDLVVLDVGSGFGIYSEEISKYVEEVVGVEPFKKAYLYAKLHKKSKKVKFLNLPVEKFDTRKRFDVVLSLTTLEHMPHADKSFTRTFELMREGGIIYLTAPNKLWPYDNHYHLPFLTWLPLPIANWYLRITGHGVSYRDSYYSMTYWGLKNFLNGFNCSYEFILPDASSKYIGCGDPISGPYSLFIKLGIRLISRFSFFWAFSKGFIVLIKKVS